MAFNHLKKLNRIKFLSIPSLRKKIINNAPEHPIPKEYPVNALARRLHPVRQNVKILKRIIRGEDCCTYIFVPDTEKGTEELAYFAAGKYISVFLEIDGMPVTRAYSLCSSPKEALEGRYAITVKGVRDGLASRYILDNWKEGDSVQISAPEGSFEYVGLRDADTVICLAGGSGITPFISMAMAIADGDEDFNMILLYGSQTADGILFKDVLDEISANCPKINVVHVLSAEERDGYEHGFITSELIQKYAPNGAYSVFACGPQVMYDFLDKELPKLGLEKKYIRYELYGEIHDASAFAPQQDTTDESEQNGVGKATEIKIKVSIMDDTYEAVGSVNDTILQTLEKNGIPVPSRCRSGECGWCHSYLKSGKVYVPEKLEARRAADKKYGFIHPCCTFPLSDLEMEVPYSK